MNHIQLAIIEAKIPDIFNDECLLWNYSKNQDGYGIIWITPAPRQHNISLFIHRLVGVKFNLIDDYSSKLSVLHTCPNRHCYNLKHLYSGTQSDNNKDQIKHGTHCNSSRLYCIDGHPLYGPNLYIYYVKGKEHRACKRCKYLRKVRAKDKR